MKPIGKYKIIKHSPNKNATYPLVRLPQSHAHIAGEIGYVFETEHNGKPVFVISLDEDFDGCIQSIPKTSNSGLETRVNSLEEQLKSLEKSLSESQKQSSSTRNSKE